MQNNQIHKAEVLLAAAVVVGGIFIATITTGTGTSVVLIPSAYAEANCDKADAEPNNQGNQEHTRGNFKHCVFLDTEGEQPRNCASPNKFKDNDGDGFVFCIERK
jgi:hypothetical protein